MGGTISNRRVPVKSTKPPCRILQTATPVLGLVLEKLSLHEALRLQRVHRNFRELVKNNLRSSSPLLKRCLKDSTSLALIMHFFALEKPLRSVFVEKAETVATQFWQGSSFIKQFRVQEVKRLRKAITGAHRSDVGSAAIVDFLPFVPGSVWHFDAADITRAIFYVGIGLFSLNDLDRYHGDLVNKEVGLVTLLAHVNLMHFHLRALDGPKPQQEAAEWQQVRLQLLRRKLMNSFLTTDGPLTFFGKQCPQILKVYIPLYGDLRMDLDKSTFS